jgi:hypothetical protein
MRIWPSKRRWMQLAIGLLSVVVILAAADGFMIWRTDARLSAKIAEIRAAGDPASIADLAPQPIPADQNAAAYLEKVAPRLDQFAGEHGRFFNTPIGKAFEAADDRGEPPTGEQIAAIRAIVEKYPDIQTALAAAAACDQYASLADFTLNQQAFLQELLDKRIGRARTAARFNDWRTLLLMADGKPNEAVEVGLQSLKLARLHDAEPLLVNQLVGVALRAIASRDLYDALTSGSVTPQLHDAIDQELVRHDDPQRLAKTLKSERAYGIALTASLAETPLCPNCNPWLEKVFGWPMKRFYLNAVDYYDVELAAVARPWYETRKMASHGDSQATTGYGVLADLLLPALQASYDAEGRNVVTLRALRIFNALARYRDEHGREASGLQDLSLPKEATIDPFSGEPLKVKRTDEGWVIYSVGTNGIDDGGDFKDQKDVGLAPRRR